MTVEVAARPRAGLSHAEAITSLGENLAETALLYRAGIANVQPSDFIDAQGRRVMLCLSPALPPDLPAQERLVTLAAHALAGMHRKMAEDRPSDSTAPPVILLCLGERFAESEMKFDVGAAGRELVAALREELPPAWAAAEIEPFPFGRAAGALAMHRALQLAGAGREVVWGGVDCFADWPLLCALEREDRLMTPGNVDGLRPGEAAAFAAVTPASQGEALLLGLGLGREPHPVGAEAPCLSDGMSQALETAVEPLRRAGARCDLWMLDATHESYATHEVQNMIARFGDVLGTQTDLQMPLKELGDVGAASMPLLVALAMQAWRFGLARDDTAVVTGCSDKGARGALLLASRRVPSVHALEAQQGAAA